MFNAAYLYVILFTKQEKDIGTQVYLEPFLLSMMRLFYENS